MFWNLHSKFEFQARKVSIRFENWGNFLSQHTWMTIKTLSTRPQSNTSRKWIFSINFLVYINFSDSITSYYWLKDSMQPSNNDKTFIISKGKNTSLLRNFMRRKNAKQEKIPNFVLVRFSSHTLRMITVTLKNWGKIPRLYETLWDEKMKKQGG